MEFQHFLEGVLILKNDPLIIPINRALMQKGRTREPHLYVRIISVNGDKELLVELRMIPGNGVSVLY